MAKLNYFSGLHAEDAVARMFERRGAEVQARRWRGSRGEIDLILQEPDGFVFVEVKKSRTHAEAAARVSQGQIRRIMQSALEFLGAIGAGAMANMRFDVATVDCHGDIEVIENAFFA